MNLSKSILYLALSAATSGVMAAGTATTTPEVFVDKAAQSGMAEVALGKLALSKSKNEAVQEFAQRMVTDHGKANTELAAMAKAKGLNTPRKLDSKHEAMLDSMKEQEGAAFDQAYALHMNMDHSKAIDLFESAAASADADVAGFARKTLPTLKEHKMMAEKLPAKQQ